MLPLQVLSPSRPQEARPKKLAHLRAKDSNLSMENGDASQVSMKRKARPMECQNIERLSGSSTDTHRGRRRKGPSAINAGLTSFFMWPRKNRRPCIRREWRGPRIPFRPRVPREEAPRSGIGGRRSVTLYLCCHPACQRRGYRGC